MWRNYISQRLLISSLSNHLQLFFTCGLQFSKHCTFQREHIPFLSSDDGNRMLIRGVVARGGDMNISADLFNKEDESFTNMTLRLLHGHLIASSAYVNCVLHQSHNTHLDTHWAGVCVCVCVWEWRDSEKGDRVHEGDMGGVRRWKKWANRSDIHLTVCCVFLGRDRRRKYGGNFQKGNPGGSSRWTRFSVKDSL